MKENLPKPKKPLLNKTFFLFLTGFAVLLIISFAAIVSTSYYGDELDQFGAGMINCTGDRAC